MQEAIALAPEWAKGYLRAGRALTHLGRFTEAVAALKLALELAPGDKVLRDAAEQALWLQRAREKEDEALESATPGSRGTADVIGIKRGECLSKKGCDCKCYVQRVASNAVMLMGRYVRHDNETRFLNCQRCGCPSYMHRDLRKIFDARPGPKGQRKEEEEAKAKRAARLNRPVPHSTHGARGNLDSSYYYGVVPQSGTAPVVPKKVGPDGELVPWDGEAAELACSPCSPAREEEAAEAEAMGMLRDVAARGGDLRELRAAAVSEASAALADLLKRLGFGTLGARKRVEQALLMVNAEQFAACAGAGAGADAAAPHIEVLGTEGCPAPTHAGAEMLL